MNKIISTLALYVLPVLSLSGKVPGLVPAPVSVTERPGEFIFSTGTVMKYTTSAEREVADLFSRRIGIKYGAVAEGYMDPVNHILFRIDPLLDLPDEGYSLTVWPDSITVTGRDRGGLFYGMQTLLQLVPADVLRPGAYYHNFPIPAVEITDYPRFGYRGFSFDVARTFTGVDGMKRLLEQMAFHKLNRLHWHLTDDEGWRIELESHPRLAIVGGFRGGDWPVHNIYGAWGERYGGYFTKDQIRDVVAYAATLNIEIIPEFDIPGHSRAFARVYPEILCRGPVDTVSTAGYDMRKVWCAAREENYTLIGEILDELVELFPGAMIHTGGDEVPPEQWETCPDCRALMQREGLADTRALNTWFCNRVGEMVRERGRQQFVWNEAVDGGFLDKGAIISAWENAGSVADALKKGYRTVAMPSQYYYFDMKQSATELGLAWAAVIDTERVYRFEPVPAGYGDEALMGVEGAFWTETYLWNGPWWMDYQLFPRMCALAETAWSQKDRKNWANFNDRLEGSHLERLAALGIGYRGRDGIRIVAPPPQNRIIAMYTVTGSVPATARNPYGLASDGNDRTFARTVRTPREGDWFEYRFDTPVKCGSITIKTGYNAIPRFVVAPAVLEVSYDGESYTLVDDNFGYTGTFRPTAPVHKIRLTVKGTGNGEDAAILYDLIIAP